MLMLLFTALPVMAAIPGDGERIAQTCSSCHGTQGASPSSHIPVIGGQTAEYLKKTMLEYRDGTRPGGVMANLAKGYSDSQIDEMSKAISSWKWKNTPLATKSTKKKVSVSTESCAACHGKKGEGTAMAPHINGQSPKYMREALQEYKDGKRNAPTMGMVKGMSDTDLDVLVTFYTRK
jgi:sulfide dehydrogenase cytochrome subunit